MCIESPYVEFLERTLATPVIHRRTGRAEIVAKAGRSSPSTAAWSRCCQQTRKTPVPIPRTPIWIYRECNGYND